MIHSRRRSASALLALGLLTAAPTVVRAVPSDSPPASTAGARDHYRQGLLHYDLGEFDQAIVEFKHAYALTEAPEFLFNLGQACRLKKDYEQALYFYESYLRRAPAALNRRDVERRIAEMHLRLNRRPEPAVLGSPGGGSSTEVDQHAGRSERWTGLAVGGGGLALIGVGIYFGVQASSASDRIEALASQNGRWDAAHQALYEAGQRDRIAATVLLATGGAAVVTGGVLYYLGWRADQEARQVLVTPSGGGASIVVGGRF